MMMFDVETMKGPFLVQALGGPTLYAGWNKAAIKPALKQATGTMLFGFAGQTNTLPVGEAMLLAGQFAQAGW